MAERYGRVNNNFLNPLKENNNFLNLARADGGSGMDVALENCKGFQNAGILESQCPS